MKKSDIPMPKIANPPEDLVDILVKQYPNARDRGWYKLVGNPLESKIFQHSCRGDYLTLVLNIYNAKLPWKVAQCVKCECFYYIGPC